MRSRGSECVNAIALAAINTPGPPASQPDLVRQSEERIPAHRMGDPDQIARVASGLVSDVPGSQIFVDAGMLPR